MRDAASHIASVVLGWTAVAALALGGAAFGLGAMQMAIWAVEWIVR